VPDPEFTPQASDAPRDIDERTPEDRAADHAAIDRLAADLLPALVAKLGATGLGEIEVREGDWKVRLRRPADAALLGRRTADRPARAQPGHAGHGHPPAALEGHRAAAGEGHRPAPSSNGHGPELAAVGPGRDGDRLAGDPHRAIATSPAVGIFQPVSETRAGTRVRAGDRIGAVDMLGVPLEVVAPADGVIGASLVEAGQAVEYGQDLIVVELLGGPAGGHASRQGPASGPPDVAGDGLGGDGLGG
jgi:biotin carboxyl carrier protein